ncbi:MAG TPA: hypothetical protein VME43_31090 [Bryobacteraceae bacterium]|nr:hypothetical protein [Bryobacteraceae bacterium]
MIQDYGRMQPLYEAMSVGSYTVAWLEREERDRSDFELQFNLARLNRAIEGFIEVASNGNPLLESPRHVLQGLTFCVETLNCLTQRVTSTVRERLQRVGPKPQAAIGLLLDQTDMLAEKVEGILESWQIALDENLSAKVDTALSQIDRSKTEIPDWRKTLELISD